MKGWAFVVAALVCGVLVWLAIDERAETAPTAVVEERDSGTEVGRVVPSAPAARRDVGEPTALHVELAEAPTATAPAALSDRAPRSVAIRVVGVDGLPLPGVRFEIDPPQQDRTTRVLSATTDTAGALRIDGLSHLARSRWRVVDPELRLVHLREPGDVAALAAWPIVRFHRDGLREGDVPWDPDAQLAFVARRFATALTGHVLGPDGRPRDDVGITLHRPLASGEAPSWEEDFFGERPDPAWQAVTWVRTDMQGRFVFEGFPAGQVRLLGSFSDAPGEAFVVHADVRIEPGDQRDLGPLPLDLGAPPQLLRAALTLDGDPVGPTAIWEQPETVRWSAVFMPDGGWPGFHVAGSHALETVVRVHNLPRSSWRVSRTLSGTTASGAWHSMRPGVLPTQRWGDEAPTSLPAAPLDVPIPYFSAGHVWFDLTDEVGLPERPRLLFDVYYDDFVRYAELDAPTAMQDGGFGFRFPLGSYRLFVVLWTDLGKRVLAHRRFEVTSVEPVRLPVRLRPPVTLRGTLRDRTGRPLAGVRLAAAPEGAAASRVALPGSPYATTDAEGRFELFPLPADARLDLRLSADDFSLATLPGAIVTPTGSASFEQELVWDPPAPRDGDG